MTDPGPSALRSVKRPRYSSESESEELDEKPFLDHPTLYFDDGNVILTTGGTLFCVHRSILSKHSPVLRGLFEQKHEYFRGLVQITMDDTREDLEALLGLIYDGLRVEINELTVETFPAVATLLRVACKYKIAKPCQDIIARIRAEWPSTLAAHDAKQAQFRARLACIAAANRDQPPIGPNPPVMHPLHPAVPPGGAPGGLGHGVPIRGSPLPEDLIVHPASVIALLRACGYTDPSLLFPLFYALTRTTWQFGGPALGHHLAPLSATDAERLVVGLERLRARHTSLAVTVPAFDPLPTQPPHFCTAGMGQLWSAAVFGTLVVMRAGQGFRSAQEPLEEWLAVVPAVSGQHARFQVCAACCGAIVAKIEGYRRELWASLPAFFELR